MKNKQFVIFDFDGTLFDSRIGIINGVIHAANHFGWELPNDEIMTSFIGPPLGKSFQKHFNISQEDSLLAIEKLREYYGDKGIFESKPYDGVKELLEELRALNKGIGIATAKPTKYANQILADKGWSHYFDSVHGSSMHGELYPKARTINSALEDLKVFDFNDAVMIGDTIYDIKGAEEVGVESIGVNYGYGKERDLKDARPTRLVQSVEELHKMLL